jgi:cardiolipin synthase
MAIIAIALQALTIFLAFFEPSLKYRITPDQSVGEEITCAVRDRGVDVRIITPGQHNDHRLTRRSSRRLYGDLLKAGARIFEYQPSMIHTKSLVIDDQCCAVGSTNFDHRSFSINDEVNLAASDERMASELNAHFAEDVLHSNEITYDQWVRRPIWERMHEGLGWIVERQE